jgi:hypothetical protein
MILVGFSRRNFSTASVVKPVVDAALVVMSGRLAILRRTICA